jgi:ubiquinone/menaquinone biosynthesis C-methylase UbiE
MMPARWLSSATVAEGFSSHPLFARMYIKSSPGAERRGAAEHRTDLLAGLRGSVIEVGAGNGLNFTHYPPSVERLLAVEPEPVMREAAERAAAKANVPVEVVDGVAERLPAEDSSFDAGVACLVLCTVDAEATLAELRRVIKPGGELRFYEHVVARGGPMKVAQQIMDRTFWPHVAGGCHTTRDTTASIEQAGFEIEDCRRFGFSPAPLAPSIPHVLGRARVPAT